LLTFTSRYFPGLVTLIMSEKKKFTIEYEIKSSPRILYSFLNEPNGLTQWFADDVSVRDQVYTFTWDGEQQKAKLINIKENKLVRFKWLEDEPQCYFEMEIIQDELTNDVALSITDFATEDTIGERKLIWDNQIEYLISVLGA
jgi:uncharacterized protein YndB with AHSA1/START domain